MTFLSPAALPLGVSISLVLGCATKSSPSLSADPRTKAEIDQLEAACCVGFGLEPDRKACEQLFALGKRPRELDPKPRVQDLDPPLEPGRVEANFFLNTGGDQWACRPVQAGLGVEVRVSNKHFTQQFASCDHAGHGDATAPPNALEGAECDGRIYALYREGTAFVVRSDKREVVRIPF